MQEEIVFYGHPNVLALHTKTIEITKDDYLTEKGDCIIGVNSNKSCDDLNVKLKRLIQTDGIPVKFEFLIGNYSFKVNGFGNRDLNLTNKHDLVLRKSSFISPRTVSIKCDKSSNQIPREIISELRNSRTKGILIITVPD
ncbi:MAG: DUF371 domain-containing protein [Nitrososphaeraceae archaeon]|nr:DUF371 domain-containing protein [Nitrososphaeraceae archaeon]